MSASKLDAVYRSILLTKFFTKGWGKPENLRRLFEFRKVVSNRDECFKLIERDYPVTITKEQNLADCKLIEGYFMTPLERYLPGIVPKVAQKAHFQAILPIYWSRPDCKPVCLHLAGTGDHFFWRRRNLMVKPLIKEAGIGGIILENPFYGLRKPIDQVRSSLHNVSDIFVMGGCLILESLVLFHWCERNGLGPLGVTGLSMGGHMASLAATNWPKPLVLVPCLSWSTASAVFLQGVMSHSINWDLLEDQYLSDGAYKDKLSKMVTIVDEAFLAGKKFARTYAQTVHAQTPVSITQANKNTNLDITYKECSDARNKAVEKNDAINIEPLKIKEPTQVTIEQTKTTVQTTKAQTKETESVEQATEYAKATTLTQANEVPNKSTFETQMDNIGEELKKLLDEGKINHSLYSKLTSNERFELDASDIGSINKLNEGNLKSLLLICRAADMKNKPFSTIVSKSGNTKTAGAKDEKTTKTIDITKKSGSEINDDKTLKSIDITKKNSSDLIDSNQLKALTKPKAGRRWNVADLTSDWLNLRFMRSEKKIDITKIHWRDREALQFMRGIMDECTHLSNFSVPYDTSLIIAVCAKHDAYVPREDVGTLEEIWPGAEVRYVDAGHVSAYILHQSLFRSCIVEAFERSKKKWKDGKHID